MRTNHNSLMRYRPVNHQMKVNNQVYNVLDGGSLLQRFPWKNGETFDSMASTYVKYVNKLTNTVVVFNGYEAETSTKYVTHLIRSKGVVGPKVVFTSDMVLKSKRNTFWPMSITSRSSSIFCLKSFKRRVSNIAFKR